MHIRKHIEKESSEAIEFGTVSGVPHLLDKDMLW